MVMVDGKSANLELVLKLVLLGHELGHETLIYIYIHVSAGRHIGHPVLEQYWMCIKLTPYIV